ncbi:MAG TPA: hypothetical protein VGF67_17890 [Ktedonobacteraceae bacterium]|jgi:hypothetical protein
MTTTGELRAIIEELQLIDIGDATSYLGEERPQAVEVLMANSAQTEELPTGLPGRYGEYTSSSCEESFS